MKRAFWLVALLAACGEEEAKAPPAPGLWVVGEDGSYLSGQAFLRTSKLNPQLLTIDLSAKTAKEGEPSWTFSAIVPRDKVLRDGIPELAWPLGSQVAYESAHGAGDKGTASVSVTPGRMRGVVLSEGGASSLFVAGSFTIECMVGYFDVPAGHRPPDAHTNEMIPDTFFETEWCNPLKALR